MKYREAAFAGSFPDYRNAPRTGIPEISIGGRSNVGKSSLINSLLNRKKLAQISKTPGKTRLLNYYALLDEKGRELAYFVDLPGYGYARVSAQERKSWKALVEGYVENSQCLAGFVLLVDSRRGLQDDEIEFAEYLLNHGRAICPVLTKSDKLTRQGGVEIVRETAGILRKFGSGVNMPILHSSVKKVGNDHIWRWIDERIRDARQ